MKSVQSTIMQKRLLTRYVLGLAVGWTLVVGVLISLTIRRERQQASETALTQARSNFQRDVIYRLWNARYGPLYARVGRKGILPNPYLAGIPDRDIRTTKKETLTMVNPAYMTRLVFELADREYGVKGHITSLRPLRPENGPDAWETDALKAFEHGSEEVSSVERISGDSYLRMMKPLKTEQECLACHAKQGYRVGDIRGGISVAVPMAPLYGIARQNIIVNTLSFTVLWVIGLGGIMVGATQLDRTARQRDKAAQDVLALNRDLTGKKEELEAANRELEAFSYTVSHDLRSPLSTIGGFSKLISELPSDKHPEKCAKFSRIISQETLRMEKLIETLFGFSRLSRVPMRVEAVNLSRLAAEIASELRQSAGERTVTFTVEENLTATGDPDLLRIVMHNLLANAWKYTGKRQEALVEFGALKREGETIYFVRDNGAGFEKKQAGRLFDAFHRLHSDKEFQGTGIGLATVKRIIARHGGRVWAEGETEKGATIYFAIPRRNDNNTAYNA